MEDKINGAKANLLSAIHLEERLKVAKSLVPPNAQKILDIGCGEGYFLGEICKERKIDAFGVDVSEKNLGCARLNAPKAKFLLRDATNTGFRAGEFDCVSALEVIDHIDEPRLVLGEARRILKKGGTLVLSFPESGAVWDSVWWVWTRTLGRRWYGEHEHFFKLEEFVKMLEGEGFATGSSKTAFFGMINVISVTKV